MLGPHTFFRHAVQAELSLEQSSLMYTARSLAAAISLLIPSSGHAEHAELSFEQSWLASKSALCGLSLQS